VSFTINFVLSHLTQVVPQPDSAVVFFPPKAKGFQHFPTKAPKDVEPSLFEPSLDFPPPQTHLSSPARDSHPPILGVPFPFFLPSPFVFHSGRRATFAFYNYDDRLTPERLFIFSPPEPPSFPLSVGEVFSFVRDVSEYPPKTTFFSRQPAIYFIPRGRKVLEDVLLFCLSGSP